ncbi:uncharacterized protein LOC117189606 isoform X2 [Drosophila miranda]|uniref:uncharacterized protein LOC117189606 isoform X2 n=1 Tax=Drosophila miranda TaxID=7229 RepID=UPI00143FB320|nr:uncharacterized protein LOC117189606 isoform X2 [Drosophila miranda]
MEMKGIYTSYMMSLALALIWQLFLMSQLPLGDAKSISIAPTQQQSIGGINNSTSNTSIIDAGEQMKNTTSLVVSGPGSPSVISATHLQSSPSAVKHIRRSKRSTRINLPFDFHTKHLPCDMDMGLQLISHLNSFCIWAYNNKYAHEGTWRVWQMYKLEGFFFGQYYERLKRYEIDPHGYVWPKDP